MASPIPQGDFELRELPRPGEKTFAESVREGLTTHPKSLPCRYLYDAEGSRLFDAICELPEYYPTRTEAGILRSYVGELVDRCAPESVVVELGSGSSIKTEILLEEFLRRRGSLEYEPIDVSRSALEDSGRRLMDRFSGLWVRAIVAEYLPGLQEVVPKQTKLVTWLGSSVGNFDRPGAISFLKQVRAVMSDADRFLLGVDRRKDKRVLEAAYDDAQGVTAAFNKNLLARINRELGGNFRLEDFSHRARYLEDDGRVCLHLISETKQSVTIESLGLELLFEEGEAIHTEDSYKYSPDEIIALASAAGFEVERDWTDEQQWFSVCLLKPASR